MVVFRRVTWITLRLTIASLATAIDIKQLMSTMILIFAFSGSTKVHAQKSGNGIAKSSNGQLTEEKIAAYCSNFTIGKLNAREFYSPGYPESYPGKIECIKTISAEYGYVIRLDFRDQFQMEPSPHCEYDYLEVRDGEHGYSPLIAKLCGTSFPNVITSTEGYLWLKFISDENIEYTGFRAVYDYILNPATEATGLTGMDRPDLKSCYIEAGGYEGVLSNTDIPPERYNYTRQYENALDCVWEITVAEGWKINVNFTHYKLQLPNECHLNFIDLYGDVLDERRRIVKYCSSIALPQTSLTNKLHLRFKVTPQALDSQFEVVYTAFRPSNQGCEPEEFDCEDNTCVEKSLRCNGRINCKNFLDEENCSKIKQKNLLLAEHVVIVILIGLVLLLSICLGMCSACYSKLKEDLEDKKKELENQKELSLMQQQKQEGMTVLDKMSDVIDDMDHGCYVPEVDLSIFHHKRTNGGFPSLDLHHHHHQDTSLMQLHRGDSGPLPPPPPAPAHFRESMAASSTVPLLQGNSASCIIHNQRPVANAYHQDGGSANSGYVLSPSELMYNPPHSLQLPPMAGNHVVGIDTLQKMKAEANMDLANRPRSFESTKSAPDVIGKH